MNRLLTGLIGGTIGSLTTTMLHELLRKSLADSPRLDKLGEEALEKGVKKITGASLPADRSYPAAMALDLFSNAWYLSTAATTKAHPVAAGTLLGILAGAGAVGLPGSLGLDADTTAKTYSRMTITVGLYTLGGLVAGLVIEQIRRRDYD